MQSPRLPWEVIERIIGHSRDHPNSLRSFALTCSQLRPRSRCVMLAAGVHLKSRDHVFALVDFLQDNPHLKPLICSIIVRATDFAPFPLLHILSDLSEIAFTTGTHWDWAACSVPSSIQPHLFPAIRVPPFVQLLLAFSSITHLVCTDVVIETEGNQAPLVVAKRRLSEKLRLKSLTIDSKSLAEGDDDVDIAYVGQVLFDPNFKVAPSTVESLMLIVEPKADLSLDLRLSEWSRLQSLTLRLPYDHPVITNAVQLLENVGGTTLKDVMLQFDPVTSIEDITRGLGSSIYWMLESVLLKFSRVGITWNLKQPLRPDRNTFWTRELKNHLPALSQRGAALVLKSETVFSAGHDDPIWAFVVSPDSKWVASASGDSTTILWDTRDGSIAQQWAFPGYQPARSLAFSPDGRHLVCGSEDGQAAVWDLREGAPTLVATLQGHARTVSGCAWSPDGTIIATASFDATVRLWDARGTFQQLHVLKEGPTDFRFNHHVAFSPDGRWLASACSSESDCCIWAIPQGTLHKVIQHYSLPPRGARLIISPVAAAFDPGSTRLATTPGHCEVEIWDVRAETGGRSFVSGHVGHINAVSFSPDGKLILVTLDVGMVKVWDVNGVELLDLKLKGHRKAIGDAHFSPCGEYIASAAEDCTVRLWRVRDGTCVAELSEHKRWVRFIGFSPDGKTLSSAAGDGTVVVRQMHDIIPMDEQRT